MAALDKTYVSNWKDYKEIRDWALVTDVIYPNGINAGKMIEWFYFPDLTEEDFDNKTEIPLWNTDCAVDSFLYKNCPFELVQNRLKEQYCDTSSLNPICKHEKGNHFKFPNKIIKGIYYIIEIKRPNEYWLYSREYNLWSECGELLPYDSFTCERIINSRKAIIRQIRKWNLPKGIIIYIYNDYKHKFLYTIKIKK